MRSAVCICIIRGPGHGSFSFFFLLFIAYGAIECRPDLFLCMFAGLVNKKMDSLWISKSSFLKAVSLKFFVTVFSVAF